jgi:hypothetical protein
LPESVSAERRSGHAAADDLAEHRQVRRDPVALLGSAVGDAEARHHLVEHQQGAAVVARLAQALEEPVGGRDTAHVAGDGLDDDAGELVAVPLDHGAHAREIVERRSQRVGGRRGRHAGGGRDAERRETRAGLDEQRVGVPVVAAGELEDLVASRRGARQAHGRHRGLGARADEAHELDRGHRVLDRRGELDLQHRRGAEARPAGRRLLEDRQHARVGMPQDHRPPGADEVDVAIAVGILDPGSLGTGELTPPGMWRQASS